jgi:hypothetical protein
MKADPDIWICSTVHDNGFKFYEMFIFVDDHLALSHKAKDVIKEIANFTRLRMAV